MTLTAAQTQSVRPRDLPPVERGRVTPVRLRFAAVALSALALLAGLVSALAASERHSATVAAWQKAEPLVVDAQAIDTSLSDADTTAAGSFLQGRLEPAALRARYSSDLAQASAMLASAAQQVGSDPAVDASIRSLTVELPIYTGLVETATFNERQASYPLAAAYLGEANSLMRSELLPAAASLYEVEGQRLTANESSSSSTWPVMLAALLFVLLLVLLVVAQRWLSTHFRRTLNVPLVAATAVILVLAIWFTVALAAQGSGVHSATTGGSGPVSTDTQARIRALQVRGDDELTLLTRDSVASYQQDYKVAVADLEQLLGSSSASGSAPARADIAAAKAALAAYRSPHDHLRQLDGSGDLSDAVALASGSSANDLPAESARLDSAISAAIGASQGTYDDSMSGAASDLNGLLWGIGILSVAAAALIIIGFRPRIAEYQ